MSGKIENFIEKLKGSDNYHTWKFAATNFLEMNDLEKCISESDTETDTKKLKKAKNLLSLSVESSIYVHIQNSTSALEIWSTLKRLYEDKGLTRKIGLLRQLISVRLDDCSEMQEYVDQIVNTSNKLKGIGFDIDDEWIGAILLAGLTDAYQPLILGIESTGTTISGDSIISKLIDNRIDAKSGSAFFTKKNRKNNKESKEKTKCRYCGVDWHKKHRCLNKKGKNENSKPASSAFMVFQSNSIQRNVKEQENENLPTANKCTNYNNEWFIDSGASSHMSPYKFQMKQKTIENTEVSTANNSRLQILGMGDTRIKTNETSVDVADILYVPKLTVNLLSVYKIVCNGNKVVFDNTGCTIFNAKNEKLIHCKPTNGVYKFNADTDKCLLTKPIENKALLWHRRLGHLNYQGLCKMRDGAVLGIDFKKNSLEIERCETCAMGKQCRQPFKKSETETKGILDLIHSDMMGPMETLSIGKARYILTFIDDFSRKVFCYFLKNKSDAFERFVELKNFVENQTERKIKALRTDNGTEYLSTRFEQMLKNSGIQHQLTTPYTPEQNGVAERYNRTIIERAKCLLYDASLTKTYWAEAVNMAVYLINRTINANSTNRTPEEIWSGKKIDLSHVKLFGSQVMVHIPKEKRRKLDFKSQKMIFVGYDFNTKGYRCMDPKTRKLIVSRDVEFMENNTTSTIQVDLETNDNSEKETDEVRAIENDNEISDTHRNNDDTASNENSPYGTPERTITEVSMDDLEKDPDYIPDEPITSTSTEEQQIDKRTRSGTRFMTMLANSITDNNTELALKCDEELHGGDPQTIREIMKRHDKEEWEEAMQEEINSLKENNTWSLTKLPDGRKTVKTKWVFKTKRDNNGKIVRYKARLVAKGYTQRRGIDYVETYAPVVRYTSIRFLIALAAQQNMKIHQMDAVTAFLQGNLDEEIYLEQPENFNDNSGRVCKLNRAIYGLKQAGRQWCDKLCRKLKAFGLNKCIQDPCVFYTKTMTLIVAIYVDDFLIFYQDENELKALQQQLCSEFKMKDMGTAKGCIGVRINRNEKTIELDQEIYIWEILKRFGMADCKATCTPSDTNTKLSINMPGDDATMEELKKIPYQEAVGSLLYLAQGTRPDIAFAINDVSRFNANYNMAHWKAVKRIFRYLRGTINYKLRYSFQAENKMIAYSDADWASDIDKRRSCTGYVFKLSGAAISWKSTRQNTVALSSTESEYMALAATVQEAVWLIQMGNELGYKMHGPLNINCDNQSAIKLAGSDGYRPRSKHIDIRFHYIRQKIESGLIKVEFLETGKMVADSLTKAVPGNKHNFCSNEMGLKFNN